MPATGARRGNLIYHWKHGWIPLDHFAALQKAHGSHKGAERVMARHGIEGGRAHGLHIGQRVRAQQPGGNPVEGHVAKIESDTVHVAHSRETPTGRKTYVGRFFPQHVEPVGATPTPHGAPHELKPGEHATVRGVDHLGNEITLTGKVTSNSPSAAFRHGRTTGGVPMRTIGIEREGASGMTRTDHVNVPDPSRGEQTRKSNAQALAEARGARLQVRAGNYRGESGHTIVGTDTHGRRVSVFVAGDRSAADKAAENIRAGRPAFDEPRTPSAVEVARGYDIHGKAIPGASTAPAGGSSIHIEHTGDGTLVHGTTREDAPILKRNGFRWSGNLGAWYLPRNQTESTRSAKANALEADLKANGHEPKVTREIGKATTAAEREAAARERAAGRAERMDSRAARLAAESDARIKAARQLGDMIPMGQPILVGHHSEGKHRRALARIGSHMDKAVEAHRESQAAAASAEHARKAAAGDSPLLRQRRVDRNEAEVRKIDRMLQEHDLAVKKPELAAKVGLRQISPEHHARLTASRSELADQIAHDKAQIAAAGHTGVQAADISPGDIVMYRGRPQVVKKVNKTTVSVPTGYSWDDKVPLNQVTKHIRLADMPTSAVEAAAKSEKDPKVREHFVRELNRRGVHLTA